MCDKIARMVKRLTESALFFREYIRHFHATGAVLPSSRFLAAALARFVQKGKGADEGDGPTFAGSGAKIGTVPVSRPRRILEVGPGTGAVTRHIIRGMDGGDRLDLVELNESFVRQLERRFQTEPAFRAVADRARIMHCPIEDAPDADRYDAIVSGLPLNNFSAAEVEGILASLIGRLAPGGTLSFFEYIAIRPARAMLSGRGERERLRGIGRAMSAAFRRHEVRRDAVWLNVPPAWVHHLRK